MTRAILEDVTGITSTTALWYVSRATGVVALVLLTVVLLSAAFVAVHVLTAVTDGYVDIPLISAFAR